MFDSIVPDDKDMTEDVTTLPSKVGANESAAGKPNWTKLVEIVPLALPNVALALTSRR